MVQVGGHIKRLREGRGWSQPRLAVEAGVAVSAVSQIENGRRSPNVSTLDKLAGAFGVEVADLFPKAEAPLWSDDSSGKGAFSFQEARESLEEYCDRCESMLKTDSLTDRLMVEFFSTAAGWIPFLDVTQTVELDMLSRATGLEGPELYAKSELVQVGTRYRDLFGKIMKRYTAEIGDERGQPSPSNVVDLQEVRKRVAQMQSWAVG